MESWQAVAMVPVMLAQHACKPAQLVPVDVEVAVKVLVFNVVSVDVPLLVVAVPVVVPVVEHTGFVQAAALTQVPRVVRQLMQLAPVVLVTIAEQLVSQVDCAALPSQGHGSMQLM